MNKLNEKKTEKILHWLSSQMANSAPIAVDVIKAHAGEGLTVGACLSTKTLQSLKRRMMNAMNNTTVRTPREGKPEKAKKKGAKKK